MHPKSSRPASSEIPHASVLYIVRHLAPCIVQHPFASQIVVPGKIKKLCPRPCQHRPTFSFLVLCNRILYLKSLNQPIVLSGVISFCDALWQARGKYLISAKCHAAAVEIHRVLWAGNLGARRQAGSEIPMTSNVRFFGSLVPFRHRSTLTNKKTYAVQTPTGIDL